MGELLRGRKLNESLPEERAQASEIRGVHASVAAVTDVWQQPELLWLTRGIEQLVAERRGSGSILLPGDDHQGAGCNAPDDVERTESCFVAPVSLIREHRRTLAKAPRRRELGTHLLQHVAKGTLEHDGPDTVIHRRHLDYGKRTVRESERANPLRRDARLRCDEVDGGAECGSLRSPPLHTAIAFPVTRQVEEKYAEAGGAERSRLSEHRGSVSLRAVEHDDGRSSPRRQVPAGDVRAVFRGEPDVAEVEQGRVRRALHAPAACCE